MVALYLQHFEHLLIRSRHSRYNILRTFQKAAMVRKLLFALRSGFFDPEVVPVVVETLRLAVLSRWSSEHAIKPVFSYLITILCQGAGSMFTLPSSEPSSLQSPAAQILAMVADLTKDPQRLVKLTRSLALHRLLIIFISSNGAPYVIGPCLTMIEQCLTTPGVESFQRSFEAEGGFTLLAGTLGPTWNEDIQHSVFRMMLGPQWETEKDQEKGSLACQQLVSSILSALEYLLSVSGEDDTSRPSFGRTKSGTSLAGRSTVMTPLKTGKSSSDNTSRNAHGTEVDQGPKDDSNDRLESLLKCLTETYTASAPFRRCITGRKVEQMIPPLAEFAATSASSSRPGVARAQRRAALDWLEVVVHKAKISSALVNQMKLIIEQLQTPMSPALSKTSTSAMPSQHNMSSSLSLSSYTGRFGSTPPASPSLGSYGASFGAGTPRRRPSIDTISSVTGRQRLSEKAMPALKRVLTGESVLEGGRDKNAAWKLIIISTVSLSRRIKTRTDSRIRRVTRR